MGRWLGRAAWIVVGAVLGSGVTATASSPLDGLYQKLDASEQVLLPRLALDLPRAEPDQHRKRARGRNARGHDPAAERSGRHQGSPRMCSRPSAAL